MSTNETIENQHTKEQKNQKITIRVERYQNLLEILDDHRRVRRLAIIVFIVGLALFFGITLIVLQIKRSFTYSDITTNAFGTTTITDEQKSVSYFLFNTAELWANSGIEVKKGDVISIYSSGTAHTAIHHLYKAAQENSKPSQSYFSADGEIMLTESKRDQLRSKYRIFPNLPQNALVMQVSNHRDSKFRNMLPDSATVDQFYYIAGKRDKIHILQDGTLYFAVNDIVLDRSTIVKMQMENLVLMQFYNDSSIRELGTKIYPQIRDSAKKYGVNINVDNISNNISQLYIREHSAAMIYKALQEIMKSHADESNAYCDYLKKDDTFKFGKYSGHGEWYMTEMDYYYQNKYYQAWFDDNVGSFLIMVEKSNNNLNAHGK